MSAGLDGPGKHDFWWWKYRWLLLPPEFLALLWSRIDAPNRANSLSQSILFCFFPTFLGDIIWYDSKNWCIGVIEPKPRLLMASWWNSSEIARQTQIASGMPERYSQQSANNSAHSPETAMNIKHHSNCPVDSEIREIELNSIPSHITIFFKKVLQLNIRHHQWCCSHQDFGITVQLKSFFLISEALIFTFIVWTGVYKIETCFMDCFRCDTSIVPWLLARWKHFQAFLGIFR